MNYPTWICDDCGSRYGSRIPTCACYHLPDPHDPYDRCGWCGTMHKPLTEPRDFGYPPEPDGGVK